MNVAVAAVMSIDGKLTRHDEPDIYTWVSDEDQTHFAKLLTRHDAIVMGRGTYESVKDKIKLSPGKLRIVLTTHSERYFNQGIPAQLEFMDQSAAQTVQTLESRGFKDLLVVGGSQIISDFMAARLVNRLYLTIEPRIFGTGQPLVATLPTDTNLQLEKHQKLNNEGTLLLTYRVL